MSPFVSEQTPEFSYNQWRYSISIFLRSKTEIILTFSVKISAKQRVVRHPKKRQLLKETSLPYSN